MYTRYRIALAALALLALSIAPPAAAAQAAETAPLTLADFAGSWGRHGFGLTVSADGSIAAGWRTYKIDAGDGPSTPQGKATFGPSRVEGRTLYGTVLTTTDADTLARGPFTLTEHDYGIGELLDARALGAAAIGAPEEFRTIQTLCGPRIADAPRWFMRTMPCGA